jgi:hypothetical protein
MKRVTATGLALAATALTMVPVAGGAKPPKQKNSLTIAAAPNPVVFGRATAVSGRLSGNKHAGQTVSLQADPYPYDRFAGVAGAVTAANGDVSFQQRPRLNTRYRLRRGSTDSTVLTVAVRYRVSLGVRDSTPASGRRIRFSGRACPTHDGGAVAIQRRTSSGAWRTAKRTTLLSATRCSTYSTRLRVRRDATYRAVVAGDAGHARGISARRRVDVH